MSDQARHLERLSSLVNTDRPILVSDRLAIREVITHIEAEQQDADLVGEIASLTALLAAAEAERDSLQAEVEKHRLNVSSLLRMREALGLIKTHAQLDLNERGVAEAERYVGIADAALNPEGTEG